MKFTKFAICFFCFFTVLSLTSLHSREIDNSLLAKIDACVYEVVLEKPKEGKLEYAKRLPYENLPYKIRSDKYIPIGTAFALPNGKLISAAHLFSLEKQTLSNNFFIRDRKKNIFPIENIYQYNDAKDYIIFDASGFTPQSGFTICLEQTLNEVVYTVGNALGDGIILREGLLTSTTLESENGAWEWLRFSAAASPGNSGGPLLNKEGDVVGLIVMKSANENLNYALPISYALNSEEEANKAILHKRIKYSIALFNNYLRNSYYDFSIDLPLKIDELRATVQANYSNWIQENFTLIKQEWEGKIFPFTKGSSSIIHSVNNIEFPGIIAQRQDGGWGVFSASDIQTSEIDGEGSVRYGTIGSLTFAHFIKPKKVSFSSLFSDSKLFMDLILQGMPFYREIGGESVFITSMGKADKFEDYEDSFGRKWIVGEWSMDYVDMKLLLYALPVVDGFICIMHFDTIDSINNNYRYDFKFMSDFICFTYQGTFNAWQEFLTLGERLPVVLQDAVLNWNEGELEFGKGDFLLKNNFSQIKWGGASSASLSFSYDPIFDSEGNLTNVVWAPRAIILNNNAAIASKIEIKRMLAPLYNAPDSYLRLYNQVLNNIYPYDGHIITGATFLQKYFVVPANTYANSPLSLVTISHYHPNQKELISSIDSELKSLFVPARDNADSLLAASNEDKSHTDGEDSRDTDSTQTSDFTATESETKSDSSVDVLADASKESDQASETNLEEEKPIADREEDIFTLEDEPLPLIPDIEFSSSSGDSQLRPWESY